MFELLRAMLIAYPLAVLSLAMVVEGPVATVAAGALVGAGVLGWWPVWVVAVAADVLADSCLYALGRSGTRPRIAALLTQLGLGSARRDELSERVTAHLPAVVVGAKIVDVGAVPAFLAAGLSGVSFGRFLSWVTAATVVRAGVLVGLGALLGTALTDELVHRPWIVFLAGATVLAVVAAARVVVGRLAARRSASCAS